MCQGLHSSGNLYAASNCRGKCLGQKWAAPLAVHYSTTTRASRIVLATLAARISHHTRLTAPQFGPHLPYHSITRPKYTRGASLAVRQNLAANIVFIPRSYFVADKAEVAPQPKSTFLNRAAVQCGVIGTRSRRWDALQGRLNSPLTERQVRFHIAHCRTDVAPPHIIHQCFRAPAIAAGPRRKAAAQRVTAERRR